MKYLIYSLLAITLSSPALAINWDAINQSKAQAFQQAYHQSIDIEEIERGARREQEKKTEYIHSADRMEACIKRVDQYAKHHGPDLGTLNVKINQCSKEARIPLEQYEREMEQRYMNEQ